MKGLERQNRYLSIVTTLIIDIVVMTYHTFSKPFPIHPESPAKLSLLPLPTDIAPTPHHIHSLHSPHYPLTYTPHSPSHPSFSQLPLPPATPLPHPSPQQEDTYHSSQQTIPSPLPPPHSSQVNSATESKSTSPH